MRNTIRTRKGAVTVSFSRTGGRRGGVITPVLFFFTIADEIVNLGHLIVGPALIMLRQNS